MADTSVYDKRSKDLTGLVFGLLTAIRYTGSSTPNYYRLWECRCACGTTVIVSSGHLLRGSSTTCGCRNVKRYSLTGREYRIWSDMKTRCYNPNSKRYVRYGGRGITVCERWKNDYRTFLADMGPCPPGLSIDRINNDGHYEPANCRWADARQQTINSSHARMLTHDGRTQCMSDWARELGVPQDRIQARLSHGWSIHDALTIGKRINKYA